MSLTIILNGQTDYSIVIPDNPHRVEKTASLELNSYIKKVFGVELSVVKESEFSGKGIYIGCTNYAQKAGICGSSKENWIIKIHNGNLILTGGQNPGERGIIYSVYHFLEDVVGIRWWNRWHEYIPDISELSIDDNFSMEGTPAFSYRKSLGHMDIDDFYYDARTRGNVIMEDDALEGLQQNENVKDLGGAMHMGRPGHVHSFPLYFSEEDFEKRPEWFAWNDIFNAHVPDGHFCLTNDEVYEEVLKKLTAYIEEDIQIAKETGVETPCFYSLSFRDSDFGFCQCEKCKSIIAKSGISGYALQFINKIARAVAPKYPHVKIETLAYASYLEPPKDDTLPEKNVIIRLAHLNLDIIHGINEKGNILYKTLLEKWSDICKKAGCDLHIWEYMYHFYMALPSPIAYRLCDTFRTFKDYGVDGIFIENENRTMSLWELNQYMLLHLCEDPYADEEYLINDFMTKFFGKASKYMRAYLDEIRKASKRNEYSVFCLAESIHFNFVDVITAIKCHDYLEKAAEAVSDDEYLTLKVMWEQKILASQILIKFNDLKKMAQRENLEFNFDKKTLLKKILHVLEMVKNTDNFTNSYSSIHGELAYFSNYDITDDPMCPLPKELEGVNYDDVYQFHFKNLYRHMNDGHLYGFDIEEDQQSSLGKIGRFKIDKLPSDSAKLPYTATSRNASFPHPVKFMIEQNSRIIDSLDLYLEDIVPGEYKLYKIGTVSDIKNSSDSRITIFGEAHDYFSLTGVSVVFPMNKCDVYASLKFDGPMYGGSEKEPNTLSIDRMIVVRKDI